MTTHGPRVLHVSSTFTAGVYEAVRQYVTNAPTVEHHLLVEPRDLSDFPRIESATFLHRRKPLQLIDVRRAVKQIRPDIIHAHSSWAGLWTRVARLNTPLIYQPHALASEGYGASRRAQRVFRTAERLLARRTQMFIALSPRESDLLATIGNGRPVATLHNVAALPPAFEGTWRRHETPRFGMLGRVSPQKDPQLFAQIATRVLSTHPHSEFVWIGDGDLELRRLLERAGVRVTGWIDTTQVADELAGLTTYLHTARYEGFPLSVLDAAFVGVPTAIRSAAWSAGIALPQFTNVDEAVAICDAAISAPEGLPHAAAQSKTLTAKHSAGQQARDLTQIYSNFSVRMGP